MRLLTMAFVLIMFGFPAFTQDQSATLNLDLQNIAPMNQTLDSMRADRSSGKYSKRIFGFINRPYIFRSDVVLHHERPSQASTKCQIRKKRFGD